MCPLASPTEQMRQLLRVLSKHLNTLEGDIPTPFASAGAFAKHPEHSLDEHGMSRLRYSSLTIFCTFPLLVDLTNTLLEMLEAYGSANDRLRLVIVAFRFFNIDMFVQNSSSDSSEKSLVPSLESQTRQLSVECGSG